MMTHIIQSEVQSALKQVQVLVGDIYMYVYMYVVGTTQYVLTGDKST